MPQVENSLNNIQKQKPATYENSLSLPPSIFYQMSFMDAQTDRIWAVCSRTREIHISVACMNHRQKQATWRFVFISKDFTHIFENLQ